MRSRSLTPAKEPPSAGDECVRVGERGSAESRGGWDPRLVWVIVPAYNEAETIEGVVASLCSEGYTTIVVDDGSSDTTASLARRAGATVLRHSQNLGQGGALWTGITFALHHGAELICTFDADGQHRVQDVERMGRCLMDHGTDVVLGSRFLGGAYGIPFSRKLLLRLAILFTRIRSGLSLTDTHNGLRLMRADAARKLDLRQLGMAHASEIIERIGKLKFKVCEAPVTVHYTEYSVRKGQSSVDSIKILIDLLIGRIAR